MTVDEALARAHEAAAAYQADHRVRQQIHDRVRTMESLPNRAHTMEARLLGERASSLGDPARLKADLDSALNELRDAVLTAAEPHPPQKGKRK